MGTEAQQGDIFVVADPYGITDHCRDGYDVLMAECLLCNFSIYGAFPKEESSSNSLFLAASPVG